MDLRLFRDRLSRRAAFRFFMSADSLFNQQPIQPDTASLQPFPCGICGKRFTRLENLKRHAAVHDASKNAKTLPCPHCKVLFSRNDLRRRHMSKKHPESGQIDDLSGDRQQKRQRVDDVDDSTTSELMDSVLRDCLVPTTRPSQSIPLDTSFPPPNTEAGNIVWSPFDISAVIGNVDGSDFESIPLPLSTSPYHTSPQISLATNGRDSIYTHDSLPSQLDLFFRHVAPVFNIIHRPTFDMYSAPPALLLAMISVSAQYGPDPEAGLTLAHQAFDAGRAMLKSDSRANSDPQGRANSLTTLRLIQAHLFLVLHAMVLACGAATQTGLRLHSKCIEMSRRAGLMEPYPPRTTLTEDLDQLWKDFSREETHKRTLFLVYQFDATWYLVLSIPRQLSHLEMKHELPCATAFWDATTANQWAFHNLSRSIPSTQPRYVVAVRSAMSMAPNVNGTIQLAMDTPAKLSFDHAGALMIIFFHQTSVREFTGWSTMTGRICSERFELIHSSLLGLESTVSINLEQRNISSDAISACASWHMSMIELLLWSQPHTSGLVEGSLDAALAAATILSSTRPLELAREVIEILTPHISWFLSYLVNEPDSIAPSPFVTIYAFKAALIAWQLTRTGNRDFSAQLGLESLADMEEWIRETFGKRKSWGIGNLVLQSLDELED